MFAAAGVFLPYPILPFSETPSSNVHCSFLQCDFVLFFNLTSHLFLSILIYIPLCLRSGTSFSLFILAFSNFLRIFYVRLRYVLLLPFYLFCPSIYITMGSRGGVVVKALRYKPADRGFDSRWCHWNFSVT